MTTLALNELTEQSLAIVLPSTLLTRDAWNHEGGSHGFSVDGATIAAFEQTCSATLQLPHRATLIILSAKIVAEIFSSVLLQSYEKFNCKEGHEDREYERMMEQLGKVEGRVLKGMEITAIHARCAKSKILNGKMEHWSFNMCGASGGRKTNIISEVTCPECLRIIDGGKL